MIRSLLLMSTVLGSMAAGSVFAQEPPKNGQVIIQQAASMMAYSAGNDQARVSFAPNWSDELGWSVRAAAGSYLGDAVALGAIVEYGDDKQEYLANLGFHLSETLSLIGTVGQLAEHKQFIAEEGEDKASQLEYGLSLQADVASNLGFELNGYAVNSKASNDSIDTALIYGTEALVAAPIVPLSRSVAVMSGLSGMAGKRTITGLCGLKPTNNSLTCWHCRGI